VLNDDLLAVEPARINELEALATLIGGEPAYGEIPVRSFARISQPAGTVVYGRSQARGDDGVPDSRSARGD
jgi:hypothetical protein